MYPVSNAAQEAEVDEKTAIQIYQYCRDICSWRLLNRDAPLMLGGQGVVVKIDESLFQAQAQVLSGTCTTERSVGLWHDNCVTSVNHQPWEWCALFLIGLTLHCCPSYSNTCRLSCIVTSGGHIVVSSSYSQWPSIRLWIIPWTSWTRPQGFIHRTLNRIGAAWRGSSRQWRAFTSRCLNSYIDELMWRKRHGSTASTALVNLCQWHQSEVSSVARPAASIAVTVFLKQLFLKLCTNFSRDILPSVPSRVAMQVLETGWAAAGLECT